MVVAAGFEAKSNGENGGWGGATGAVGEVRGIGQRVGKRVELYSGRA